MSVIDEFGKSRTLFSLWEKRKLVLIFTRHMGCRFCREQVSELKKIQPKLLKYGLAVGVITVGKYQDIPKFKQEHNFSGEVYVDSSLFYPECYKTMKLGNGMQYLFAMDDCKPQSNDGKPGEFLAETQEAAVRAVGKGFADGGYGSPDSEFTGDTLQIGGAFVLGPGNSCDYSYRCSFVGDLVDLDKVVAAATGKDAEGEEIFYSRTLDWNEKLNIHAFAEALEAVPKGPVRTIVAEIRKHGDMSDLFQYSAIGAGVFVVFLACVLQVRTVADIAEQKLESVLVLAAGCITTAVLLAYVLNVKAMLIGAKDQPTQAPAPRRRASTLKGVNSDSTKSAENITGSCPAMNSTATALSIGGSTLYKLSAVDKISLSSEGDVHCDCTFLEEVDMINMTDRYTISAPVAVNSGLFTKLHSNLHSHSEAPEGSARGSEEGDEAPRGLSEDSHVAPVSSPLSPHRRQEGVTESSAATHKHHLATTSGDSTSSGTNRGAGGSAGCPVAGVGSMQLEIDPQQRLSGEELNAAQSIICYVREFLAKPNPNLGRKGPTCPFVPKSLQMDTIYLSVLTAEDVSTSVELECILLEAIQTFKALEPQSGPKASYKAIILIFPDLETAEIPDMIDGTQKRLKPNFVDAGLMLGEFHLRNNATGLHNPHFYPLRTPYPCLAIRHMVPSDIVFLNPTEFPPDVRVKMISSFLAKFGDKSTNDQQTEVARALLKDLQM